MPQTEAVSTPYVNRVQKLVVVSVDKLDLFPFGNPKTMQPRMKEVLRNSLKEFGIIDPLIVRPSKTTRGRYELLDGHHRVEDFRDVGMTEVPCNVVDLADDTKARAVALAIGRITADWDYNALTRYIDELMAADVEHATAQWLVNTTGFTATEIETLARAGSEFLDDVAAGQRQTATTEGNPDDEANPPEFSSFSVPLTEAQGRVVRAALATAKHETQNQTNADALTLVCQRYLDTGGTK